MGLTPTGWHIDSDLPNQVAVTTGSTVVSFLLVDFFDVNGAPKLTGPELPKTGISMERLQHIGKVFSTDPEGFNSHNGMYTICPRQQLCMYI